MKKKVFIGVGILAVIALIALFVLMRYTKSFSPQAQAEFNQNGLSITVNYCQPSKKGRLIFGDEADKALVPYGKVWRTGANEATLLKINKDVTFAGTPLKAGEYTLWTIPGTTGWQAVINSQTGQWGTDYNEKMDVFRASVASAPSADEAESFTISFAQQSGGTDMILHWDKTQVIVPIRAQ